MWDFGDDPMVVFNPEIVESDGEWVYEEGCLSIPGLYVEIVRPKQVLLRGIDVDGNPVEWEADELEARMFQHELDHLHGVLMFDRMTPEQRREAMAEYRRLQETPGAAGAAPPAPPAADGPACAWPSSARRRWPSRRCGRSSPPATTSSSVVTRADRRRGRGSATSPSPVKAAALELGLPVTHDIDDLAHHRRRARRRRRLRADHQAARPRRAADDQRALLAAAALARRGAGRAGAAGRRRRDRRLHHGRRGGARHRAGLRPARGADRADGRPPTSCAPSSSTSAPACSSTSSPDRCRSRRRRPARPTYADKITPDELRLAWDRPAVELDRWVRVGGAWTTFRDRRLKVHEVAVVAGAPARAGSPRRRRRDRRHGRRRAAAASPCSRRASRRCAGPTSPTAPTRRPASASALTPECSAVRVCGRDPAADLGRANTRIGDGDR